jgi:non-specific protein-tyrosine kinase
MDYVDMTIRSAKQIERLTGWTTLASIPRIKSAEPHDTLATLTNTQPSTAEAYRMVRAYIEFATHGQPVHTLMVTSAHPGEGKSVTAANLAVALAQTGLRVVLVDTNLWKPRLHTLFQQANESGFTTAIQQQGKQPATDYLVSSSVKNLHLLPSGPVPDNPLALLTSGSLVRLIAELLEQADLILFDSPPLLHAVDATLLMPAIDAALYVVRAGKTHQDTLLQVQQHFDRVQTRVLGAMLIDTPVGNTRSYGYIATAADANVSASPVHEIPARLWIQSRHITRHPPPAAPETVENKNASMQEPVRKRKL